MACEKSVNILDKSRSMPKYPWLKYTDRTKELKKASAPVHRSLFRYQEVFPPSPECWRQQSSKPSSVPYLEKPQIYLYWPSLYDQRREKESRKMLREIRERPRNLNESIVIQEVHLPLVKLTIKSQKGSKPLHPTGDPLKWQRLKELTKSLKSPREDEQLYAAQALGCLGVSDNSIIEALLQVVHTSSETVKSEACRTLAILGCLNEDVIQAFIKQLKGQNEEQKMDTLRGLRVALNYWAAVPRDKRTHIGDEGTLVSVLQRLIKKSSNEAAVEAALCLGFLRPCSNLAREFLLQCLCHGTMSQRMKALRMLVKMMHIHSAPVIRAILDQLCHSTSLEDRFEATLLLKTIGLEQIQAQGLEGLVFDLLRKKTYNEPFFTMRRAVAETAEELKMKPTMLTLVEEQLMNSNAVARQKAVISLGALGIRSPQVLHLLLDILDTEKDQSVKKSLQETLIFLASVDPWVQKKLINKVLLVPEAPKTNEKVEPTRFREKHETREELNIQDFRLAQLNPLLIAKASATSDQQNKLRDQKGSSCYLTAAFPPRVPKPSNHKPQATGPWTPGIRKELQILAKTSI
ncbi:protein HEATR9 [Rhynchonycteris naso]